MESTEAANAEWGWLRRTCARSSAVFFLGELDVGGTTPLSGDERIGELYAQSSPVGSAQSMAARCRERKIMAGEAGLEGGVGEGDIIRGWSREGPCGSANFPASASLQGTRCPLPVLLRRAETDKGEEGVTSFALEGNLHKIKSLLLNPDIREVGVGWRI